MTIVAKLSIFYVFGCLGYALLIIKQFKQNEMAPNTLDLSIWSDFSKLFDTMTSKKLLSKEWYVVCLLPFVSWKFSTILFISKTKKNMNKQRSNGTDIEWLTCLPGVLVDKYKTIA